MILLRFIFGSFFAVIFVFGIFWVLQNLINTSANQGINKEKSQMVDFIRLKKEPKVIKKERVKPKKPKPKKQPPKPKVNIQKNVKVIKQPMIIEKLDLNLPLNLSSVSALGDAFVSSGNQTISTNVIPISKVRPIYPRRAKRMKKEGFVKLEFTITTFGTVKDVDVVESKPVGLFDASAKRAILKWKFRAKIEDGSPIEQRAILQIDFKLR